MGKNRNLVLRAKYLFLIFGKKYRENQGGRDILGLKQRLNKYNRPYYKNNSLKTVS